MKDEIDFSGCKTCEDVEAIVAAHMDYYQNDRPQWDLYMLTPREFYIFETTGFDPIGSLREEAHAGSGR